MRRQGRAQLVTKRTRAERKAQRRNILLEDATITEKTRQRYFNGLSKLLPVLQLVQQLNGLDFAVSQWVEDRWTDGEALYVISDALCGLHFYEPWTKGKLPQAWRLFSAWRKLEVPSRAPPLTSELIRSMVTYALDHHDLAWATLILVGFYALLRTGELLALRPCDVLLSPKHAIISLPNTKTGKRKGAEEMVHVDDVYTLEVLAALIRSRQSFQAMDTPIWRSSGSSFRLRFAHYCNKFGLSQFRFRPYSLRRGGATHLFQVTRSMEAALLIGRWESARVARIYISDAMSFLPAMQFSKYTRRMLSTYPPPL